MDKSKILFLDIDGVLNSFRFSHNEERYGFADELVEKLRKILDKTNAGVVISSSWRKHEDYEPFEPMMNWRDVLTRKLGFKMRSDWLLGETPNSDSGKRGLEILAWFDLQPKSFNKNAKNFCIIDDEVGDILPFICKRLIIKVDMRVGLTDEDAEKAIKILNR